MKPGSMSKKAKPLKPGQVRTLYYNHGGEGSRFVGSLMKDGRLGVKALGKAWLVAPNSIRTVDGEPFAIVHARTAEVIDPTSKQTHLSMATLDEVGNNNYIEQALHESQGKDSLGDLLPWLTIGSVVLLGVVLFFQIGDVGDSIESLKDYLQFQNGGASGEGHGGNGPRR